MTDFKKYQCNVCGHIYDEAEGDEESGVAAGTLWVNVPDNWTCPQCGVGKAYFELM